MLHETDEIRTLPPAPHLSGDDIESHLDIVPGKDFLNRELLIFSGKAKQLFESRLPAIKLLLKALDFRSLCLAWLFTLPAGKLFSEKRDILLLLSVNAKHTLNKSIVEYRALPVVGGIKVFKLLLASFELPVDQRREKRKFLKRLPDGGVGFTNA